MLKIVYELARDNAALVLTIAAVCWYIWDYRPLKRMVWRLARLLEAVKSEVEILIKRRILVTEGPAVLTDYGKELAEKVTAEAIAKEYYGRVPTKESATDYSVQETSLKFATEQLPRLISKAQMKLIDDVAFNAGVKRSKILKIIGIVMRDRLLEGRRKGEGSK